MEVNETPLLRHDQLALHYCDAFFSVEMSAAL